MRDILYCIDEEKRVCVVVLKGCAADAMGEFERYTGDSLWIPSSERFRLPDTIRGVAKCHPDDEFDIEKGKNIAQAKAEAKAYLQLRTYVLNKWNTLLDIIEAAAPLKDKFVDKAEGCHTHNEEYINRISNSNVF